MKTGANPRKVAWLPPVIACIFAAGKCLNRCLNVLPPAIAGMLRCPQSLASPAADDRVHVLAPAIACMSRHQGSLACPAEDGRCSNKNFPDKQVAKYSIHSYLFHAGPPLCSMLILLYIFATSRAFTYKDAYEKNHCKTTLIFTKKKNLRYMY